jgi:3-methyladenine DNA glycosylase AlkD
MMTVQEIMTELQAKGSESIKKLLVKHGVKEPFFGVKIEFLKPIQKKVKMDYQLAKDLYATGNADAMYLAGLIADDGKMTRADLQTWVERAVSNNISEYTVPWVAAEGNHGFEMVLEWINSDVEHIAAAGWSTLANIVALKPDSELDMPALKALLQRVVKTIGNADNRVIKSMNAFMIAVGCYVAPLSNDAIAAAKEIGPVTYDTTGTACKIPDVTDYVKKMEAKGTLGKKKKTVKC